MTGLEEGDAVGEISEKVAAEVNAPRMPASTRDADKELCSDCAVSAVSTSCTVITTVGCSVTVYTTSADAASISRLLPVTAS